jgi:hypothetical protein
MIADFGTRPRGFDSTIEVEEQLQSLAEDT